MPDLVSKLREVIERWRDMSKGETYRDGVIEFCADELESLLGLEGQAAPSKWCSKHGGLYEGDYCRLCDCELKRFLATCGPSQPEPLEFHKPGQIPVNTPICDKCGKMFLECQCSQPAPSTPIVPGTAGLSAELRGIRDEMWRTSDNRFAANYAIQTPGKFAGYVVMANKVQEWADRLNTLLGAAKPAEFVFSRKELEAKLLERYDTGFLAGKIETEAQIRKSVLEEAAQVVEKAFEQSWVVQDTLDAIRALAERPAPAGEVSKGEKS